MQQELYTQIKSVLILNKSIMKKMLFLSIILLNFACSNDSTSEPQTENPTPVNPSDALTPQNARTYMADPNATAETIALFYNLKKISKTKTVIGQHDAFNAFYGNISGDSDIKKATGKDPGLQGLDFMFITDKNNNGQADNWFYQQEQKIIQDVKTAYSRGMINTFCWHLREPNNEDSFYASDMTSAQTSTAFRGLLPGGIHHNWYKAKLDKVASVLQSLTDANGTKIPVIFRPFHEFDGSWFWWGQNFCTAEEYKAVFQFTVNYLRDTKNVHNVLYAFSPDNSYTTATNYLSRYPGDTYVDILGMDNYGDYSLNQGINGSVRANQKLTLISNLAIEKVKIAALTETGYQVTASNSPIPDWFSTLLFDSITTNNPQIGYVMFWNNTQNAYYVPTPGRPNLADFVTFSQKNRLALQPNLINIYTLPN